MDPERWRAYAELAKARYEQEEDRWRSAQDRAKAVFAVAAIAASILFSRLDWCLAVVHGHGIYYWIWLVLVVGSGGMLAASSILAAVVLAPRGHKALEDPDDTVKNLKARDPDDGPEYVGKAYDAVYKANRCNITSSLRCIQFAVGLLIGSLVLAMLHVLVAIALYEPRPQSEVAAWSRSSEVRTQMTDKDQAGKQPKDDSASDKPKSKPDPGVSTTLKHVDGEAKRATNATELERESKAGEGQKAKK